MNKENKNLLSPEQEKHAEQIAQNIMRFDSSAQWKHLLSLARHASQNTKDETSRWQLENELIPWALDELKETETRELKALKAAGLPEHLSMAGQGFLPPYGASLAFIHSFFLSATSGPWCSFSKRHEKKVQLELNLPDCRPDYEKESVKIEVFTYRDTRQSDGKTIKAESALTGMQLNIFYTLFNDKFLGIENGRGIIQGNTAELRAVMGKHAPRLTEIAKHLRVLAETRLVILGIDAAGKYDFTGAVFPMAIIPSKQGTQDERRNFYFEIAEFVPRGLLKGLYEKLDLRVFWSLSSPRVRQVYSTLYALKNSLQYGILESTLCARAGFGKAKDKRSRYRRRQELIAALDEIKSKTFGARVEFRKAREQDWFIRKAYAPLIGIETNKNPVVLAESASGKPIVCPPDRVRKLLELYLTYTRQASGHEPPSASQVQSHYEKVMFMPESERAELISQYQAEIDKFAVNLMAHNLKPETYTHLSAVRSYL